ncbi:hypothetical protein NKH73_10420 [Mesorhizobium sp. M0938]|uniref:hypothetical protein n=1 Tax=unclassified Mesorhizobium TaxID=325217 RepID=UPI003334C72D
MSSAVIAKGSSAELGFRSEDLIWNGCGAFSSALEVIGWSTTTAANGKSAATTDDLARISRETAGLNRRIIGREVDGGVESP